MKASLQPNSTIANEAPENATLIYLMMAVKFNGITAMKISVPDIIILSEDILTLMKCKKFYMVLRLVLLEHID